MTDRRRAKRQEQKTRAAERRKEEQKRANRAELLRRLRFAVLAGLAVTVVLLLLNLRDPDALPSAYERFRELPTACGAEQPAPQRSMGFDEIPEQGVTSGATATIATSCGELVVELDPDSAPRSVDAFVHLAREGYYDGTVVSEVQPDIQMLLGDPDPSSPDRAYRSTIPDEYPGDGFAFVRGSLALAGGPGERSGGLLLVLEDDVPLSPRLNVIGTVVGSDDVLDRITQVERTARSGAASRTVPSETIYIERVDIDG